MLNRKCLAPLTVAITAGALIASPVGVAAAAQGDLVQKSGLDACISLTGSFGACTTGIATGHAEGIIISPDGKNAYVAAQSSKAIVIFDRNKATGVLTQKAGIKACISQTGTSGACATGNVSLNGINSVVVSPDGKNVYATAADPGAVIIFDRNTANGELTLKAGAAGCISDTSLGGICAIGRGLMGAGGFYNSTALKLSPDGKNLYVSSYFESGLAIFDRNSRTGVLTQKPGINGCFSKDGESNGVADSCTVARGFGGFDTVVVSPDGKNLYGGSWDDDGVVAFGRNTANGDLTQLAGKQGCISNTGSSDACTVGRALDAVNSIVTSPDGKTVYAVGGSGNREGTGAVVILDRNVSTGVLTQKPGPAGCISNTTTDIYMTDCTLFSADESKVMANTYDIVISRDGRNAYVLNLDGNSLVMLARARTTGALTVPAKTTTESCIGSLSDPNPCAVATEMIAPQGLALSPNGKNLYVASTNADAILTFDRSIAPSQYRVKSVKSAFKKTAVTITVTLAVPGDGTYSVVAKNGRATICSAKGTAASAGTVKLTCTAGAPTRKKLTRAKLKLSVITSFAPTGQDAASKTQVVTLPKKR